MMIADLIDQDDLYQHFTHRGVPLEAPESADHCCQQVALWLGSADPASRAAVNQLVSELLAQQNLLLPEIKEALETWLVTGTD